MTKKDKSLDEIYARMQPTMQRAAERLNKLLIKVISRIEDRKLVRAEIDGVRIKELPSLKRKARSAGWSPDDALWECPDLIAGRVVCNNVDDVSGPGIPFGATRFLALFCDSIAARTISKSQRRRSSTVPPVGSTVSCEPWASHSVEASAQPGASTTSRSMSAARVNTCSLGTRSTAMAG